MTPHLSPSQITEINDRLIKALNEVTLADLLSVDTYLLKYERSLILADLNVLLLDEYFFNLEVSLYKELGIEEAQIRHRKKYHTDAFEEIYCGKTNLLLADFFDTFSFKDGSINWGKLIPASSDKK